MWRDAIIIQRHQLHAVESSQLLREQANHLKEMALQRQVEGLQKKRRKYIENHRNTLIIEYGWNRLKWIKNGLNGRVGSNWTSAEVPWTIATTLVALLALPISSPGKPRGAGQSVAGPARQREGPPRPALGTG